MANRSIALVIMAAGFGRRFGGNKQTFAFGPFGEWIMDYTIYDALQLGFTKIVFVVQTSALKLFEQRFAFLRSFGTEVLVVIQSNDLSSYRFSQFIPRDKPFGTGHALLSSAAAVDCPFVVVNADDFYGRETIQRCQQALFQADKQYGILTAFRLSETLSGYGSVSRAICALDKQGNLSSLDEQENVYQTAEGELVSISDNVRKSLKGDALVSMNCWGFHPEIFPLLRNEFESFLHQCNITSDEFYLPSAIESLVGKKLLTVQVNHSGQSWFGVTYPEDQEVVKQRLLELIHKGLYPAPLPFVSRFL